MANYKGRTVMLQLSFPSLIVTWVRYNRDRITDIQLKPVSLIIVVNNINFYTETHVTCTICLNTKNIQNKYFIGITAVLITSTDYV